MLKQYSLAWVISVPPGRALDICHRALTGLGSQLDVRSTLRTGFFCDLPSDGAGTIETVSGEVSVSEIDEGSRVNLSLDQSPRDSNVLDFTERFERAVADIIQQAGPVPLIDAPLPGRVFISYRRADSQDVTGRIYDRLVAQYGSKSVFKDVDTIPLGHDFRTAIGDALDKCNAVLVIIGPTWTTLQDEAGRPRIMSSSDLVHLEVKTALERNLPLIPVMVKGAVVPNTDQIPEDIQALIFRNGLPVRPDPDFHRDMDRLIGSLDEIFAQTASPSLFERLE